MTLPQKSKNYFFKKIEKISKSKGRKKGREGKTEKI
jgi:hypothetical protein